MSKLYIGNLPPDTYESQLKQVFHDLNLSFTDVMLKRGGYGFVDCADQSSADHFIDKLNGYNYRGVSLVVEPSVSSLGSQHNRHMQQQQQQHSLSINDHSVSPALNNHHHPPLNHHHHNSNNSNHHQQQQQQQQTHHISAHHYNTHQPHYNSHHHHHHLPPPTAAAVPSLAHHSHHQTAPYSSSVDRCGVGVSGAVAGTRAASMTALPHATAAASLHQHPNSVHMQPPPLPSAVHRSDAGASAVNAGMMSSHHPHHHHHLNHHQANHHHHHHLNSHHHQTAGGGHSGGVVECPLRLLVTSDMVGAIIGRQGNTIRQITQSTRARVDVHRNDGGANGSDKAITIYGQPDNCDNACRRILEVMLQEASSTNKGDVPLRLLAHNNLIGRIIGKGGSVIKRIMDETDAKVTVSSVSDVCSYNMERTITICGEVDNVTDAEKLIAAKLRQSYHNDLQTMAPQSMMYSSLHHSLVPSSAAAAAVAAGYPSAGAGGRAAGSLAGGGGLYGSCPSSHTAANTAAGGMCGPLYPSMLAMGAPSSQQQQRQCAVAAAAAAACAGVRRGMAAGGGVPLVEVAYLYVPSASVGALIGRRGSHVRSIIRFSGASVKIGQQPETPAAVAAESSAGGGGGGGGGEEAAMTRRQQQPPLLSVVPATVTGRRPFLRTALEGGGQRKVTITGSAEAQWKAQFLIFDKLREEGYGGCVEEVRVPLEVPVPGSQVGRIIGKKGANVRQLQRSTGALIKLPQLSTSGGGGGGDPANADASSVKVVCVQLLGVFYAVQAAQRRIRQLVASAPPPPPLAPQQAVAVVVSQTDAASTNAATAASAGDLVDEELTDASGEAAAQQQPAAAATQIDVAASLPDGNGGSEVVSSGDASTRDSPASVTVATPNDHDIMTSPT